ncbi:MAG: HD domain-containing protein [Polyangiaceae bacterium]|nr:HD domain-containing protein [Polyangiaceae bacterium]
MKESAQADSNERMLHRMLVEGFLSSQMHEAALAYVRLQGGRIEDALVESRILTEAAMLKYLATHHKTHFVSTQKLYEKKVDQSILDLVPRRLATLRCVLPVLYDAERHTLSIVTADPDDLAMINEVKVAAGVRDVVPIVARPAAVRAAVARAYDNDTSRFYGLVQTDQRSSLFEIDRSSSPGAQQAAAQAAPIPLQAPAQGPKPLPKALQRASLHGAETPIADEDMEVMAAPAPPPRPRPAPPPPITIPTYLETLRVLVGVIDESRSLPGHAAACADLMMRMCQRMALENVRTTHYVFAAYLHDIGKTATHHLTAVNVVEDEGCKAAARELYDAPERLLKKAGLPADVLVTVSAMYERYDGKGFPQALAGDHIPLGARILAVVDSYVDLAPSRHHSAIEVLARYRKLLFDPSVLEVLSAEVAKK